MSKRVSTLIFTPKSQDRGAGLDSAVLAPCSALDFPAAHCIHISDAGRQLVWSGPCRKQLDQARTLLIVHPSGIQISCVGFSPTRILVAASAPRILKTFVSPDPSKD